MSESNVFNKFNGTIEDLFPFDKKITFLVGAGISINSPSNLPSARNIVTPLISYSTPTEEFKNIPIDKLRYEKVVEVIQQVWDHDLQLLDYFELVQEPNIVHFLLANAILKGHYVVTTNFDYLIEYALLKNVPEESHAKILPVITRENFLEYNDPKPIIQEGRYPLYKIHGAKRNIIANIDTTDSLVTTMEALSKDRTEGETFAIEPYKKPAIINLMKGRTLIVMGYSGSDDFDISPILKELPFISRLIWIEHSSDKTPIISSVNKVENFGQLSYESNSDELLAEIRSDSFFDVYRISVNTGEFIYQFLWRHLFPGELKPEIDIKKSIKRPKFEKWVKPLFKEMDEKIKYFIAGSIFSDIGDLTSEQRCFEKGLMLAEKESDLLFQALFLQKLGGIKRKRGEFQEALKFYERAHELNMEAGNDYSGDYNRIAVIKMELEDIDGALVLLEKALGFPDNKPNQVADYLNNLGGIYRVKGELDQALEKLKEALKIIENLGGFETKLNLLNQIGTIHHAKKEYDLALENYQEALNIAEQLGNPILTLAPLNNLGMVYYHQGDYDRAIEIYTKGLDLCKKIDEKKAQANLLNSIGNVLLDRGDPDAAREKLEAALNMFKEINYQSGIATSLMSLAPIYSNLEGLDKALETYEEALIYAQKGGKQQIIDQIKQNVELLKFRSDDASKRAKTFNIEGKVLFDQGDYQKALKKFEEAYEILQDSIDFITFLTIINNIAQVYRNLKNEDKSIEYFKKGLEIANERGIIAKKAFFLNALGRVMTDLRKYDDALTFFDDALEIERQRLNKDNIAMVLNNKSGVLFAKGDYDGTLAVLMEAKQLLESIGKSDPQIDQNILEIEKGLRDQDVQTYNLLKSGQNFLIEGKYDLALQNFEDGLKIAEQREDEQGRMTFLNDIGIIYFRKGDYPKSVDYLEQALPMLKDSDRLRDYGACLINLGASYQALGKIEKSIAKFEEGLEIFKELNDPDRIKAVETYLNLSKSLLSEKPEIMDFQESYNQLIEIGMSYYSRGNYKQALINFNKALEISLNEGHFEKSSISYRSLGRTYQGLKRYDNAISNFEKAIETAEKAKKGEFIALNVGYIGNVLEKQGKMQDALAKYNLAYDLADNYSDEDTKRAILLFLSIWYNEQGQYDIAYAKAEEAQTIAEKLNLASERGATIEIKGSIRESQGISNDAYELYENALELYKSIDDKPSITRITEKINELRRKVEEPKIFASERDIYAKAILGKGNKTTAIINWKDASKIYENIGMIAEKEKILENIENIDMIYEEIISKRVKVQNLYDEAEKYLEESDHNKALDYFRQALEIASLSQDIDFATTIRLGIGSLLSDLGDYDTAQRYLEEALNFNKIMGKSNSVVNCLVLLGINYHKKGDIDNEVDVLEQAAELYISMDATSDANRLQGKIDELKGESDEVDSDMKKLLFEATSAYQKGNLDEALTKFEKIKEILTNMNSKQELAVIINNIGSIYQRKGDLEKALENFEEALQIAEELNDIKTLTPLLTNIWKVYIEVGNEEEGLRRLEQTLALLEESNNLQLKCAVLNQSGGYFMQQEDFEKAINYFNEALEIAKTLNNTREISVNLGNIAAVLEKKGLDDDAFEKMKEAFELALQSDDLNLQALYSVNIGRYYLKRKSSDEAIKYYNLSSEAYIKVKDLKTAAAIIKKLGDVHKDRGELELTAKKYRESLKIYRILDMKDKIEDTESLISELGVDTELEIEDINDMMNLAETLFTNKEYDAAVEKFKEILEIDKQEGYLKRKVDILVTIGVIYSLKNDLPNAMEHYTQALQTAKQVGDISKVKVILNNIGLTHKEMGNLENAIESWDETIKFAEELKDFNAVKILLLSIAELYGTLGNVEKTVDYYEKSIHICKAHNLKQYLLQVLLKYGVYLSSHLEVERTIEIFEECIEVAEEVGNAELAEKLQVQLDALKADLKGNSPKQ